jgi:hypothetical protein
MKIMRPITAALSLLLLPAIIPSLHADDSITSTRQLTRSGPTTLRSGIDITRGTDGIVITGSNVTLDLGGNLITTRTKGTGQGITIRDAKNVKILNGRISGFRANVVIENSENVDISGLMIPTAALLRSASCSSIALPVIFMTIWSLP